jgi:cytoskeletal protein RodZ
LRPSRSPDNSLGRNPTRRASERMWSKKRQRYVFRKRSRWGRLPGLLIGTLLLVGLVWFIPWQTLSLVGVQDMLKSEASQDQPKQTPAEDEQAPAEDEPKQPDTQDQSEQAGTSDQPTNEATLVEAPPNGEGATNNLPSPSPPAVQLSPPPQTPSTPRLEEAPQNSIYPNDYWYSGADYRGSGAGYWDSDWDYYESYYYWD